MLRDYQIDICRRTVEAFRSHRSVMVQMPTGTGKTVVLASLVSSFNEELGMRNEELCSNEGLVLIVAHRRELVEQIKETIRRLGIDNGRIIVDSIQAISRRIDTLDFTPSLVVIDEAHHALAKTYRMMWEAWPKAKFLGLTATPCRLNGKGFTDLFEVLLTSHTIAQFIREGWLSLFDYYSIKADSEDQRIIDSLVKRGADGDYQAKELNSVMNRRPSIERLYESVRRYGEGKKGIVYAVSIEHAEHIARYYSERGIRAVAVSSVTPIRERERILALFKDSSFRTNSFFENSPVPSYPEEGLHLSFPNPLFPQEREGLSGAPQAGRGNGACGPSDLPLDFSTQQSCDYLCGSAAASAISSAFASGDVDSSAAADNAVSFASDDSVIDSFENSPVPSYPEEGLHLSLPNPLFPQEREGLSGAPQAGRGNGACGPSDLPLSFSTQQSCDCFCGSAAASAISSAFASGDVDSSAAALSSSSSSAAISSDCSSASSSAAYTSCDCSTTASIQVLVSVDLFSEGFDCPDVEFIQLARPTLSLAKYLQMVGRGLRKSKGKKACVIIDNVGLYRMFGLPAADRDWQAMFEGRMAGTNGRWPKGKAEGSKGREHTICSYAMAVEVETDTMPNADLEKVIDHGSLRVLLAQREDADRGVGAFLDEESGLYGLKRDGKVSTAPQYVKVFDTSAHLAAVKFQNGFTGLVDGRGNVLKRLERHAYLRLPGHDILAITGKDNKSRYVDLRNDAEYKSRPTVVQVGRIEMLRVENRYYCRIKHPYRAGFCNIKSYISDRGFYVSIFMNNDEDWRAVLESIEKPSTLYYACILANDDTDWYLIYERLKDGSIIILDCRKNYYYVEDGKEKRYIGNEQSNEDILKLKAVIRQLSGKAKRKADRMETERRKQKLTDLQDVKPFCSNNKWGLKLNGKVIVPPVYRSIKEPVGNYCAVEQSPQRWGVIQLDGKMIVETRYHDVEIMKNGTACLTLFPGKTKKMKLGK